MSSPDLEKTQAPRPVDPIVKRDINPASRRDFSVSPVYVPVVQAVIDSSNSFSPTGNELIIRPEPEDSPVWRHLTLTAQSVETALFLEKEIQLASMIYRTGIAEGKSREEALADVAEFTDRNKMKERYASFYNLVKNVLTKRGY